MRFPSPTLVTTEFSQMNLMNAPCGPSYVVEQAGFALFCVAGLVKRIAVVIVGLYRQWWVSGNVLNFTQICMSEIHFM